MAASGTTTTAIRFSTQGQPSSAAEYHKWAEAHDISHKGKTKKALENMYKRYYDPDTNWQKLRDRGYNTRLIRSKNGGSIDMTRLASSKFHKDQFRKRYERLSKFEDKLKAPFMIPASPKPELSFEEFVSGEVNGQAYLDYAAGTMAKRRRPFVDIDKDMAEFAVAQHGMSFCKANTVLVVPYIIEKNSDGNLDAIFADLTASKVETDRNINKSLGTPPFAGDTEESDNLIDKPYYGMNAEALAEEIYACDEDVVLITIEQNGFSRDSDGEHSKHANSVVLNKRTGQAWYFEPHMTDSKFSDNEFLPYYEVQNCVDKYLQSVNPMYRIIDIPTVCPDTGVGPLQSADSLCVSWAFFGGLSILLNPDIPATTITDSISIFDIARMYYVGFFFVPMTIQTGRRPSGRKETMYKAVTSRKLMRDDGDSLWAPGDLVKLRTHDYSKALAHLTLKK